MPRDVAHPSEPALPRCFSDKKIISFPHPCRDAPNFLRLFLFPAVLPPAYIPTSLRDVSGNFVGTISGDKFLSKFTKSPRFEVRADPAHQVEIKEEIMLGDRA